MKIEYNTILAATEPYILQQVNCRGVMGAGLAKELAYWYPKIKKEYEELCERVPPNILLGTVQPVHVSENRIILNVFSQLDYGRKKNVVYTNYEVLEKAFNAIPKIYTGPFAIPYGFGCGLANGDWKIVSKIIEKCFDNATIYKVGERSYV